jgi:hypothetical protein
MATHADNIIDSGHWLPSESETVALSFYKMPASKVF